MSSARSESVGCRAYGIPNLGMPNSALGKLQSNTVHDCIALCLSHLLYSSSEDFTVHGFYEKKFSRNVNAVLAALYSEGSAHSYCARLLMEHRTKCVYCTVKGAHTRTAHDFSWSTELSAYTVQ